MKTPNLAGHLQRFFTDRLLGQLGASPHTVASYRDTFRLLLKYASKTCQRQASALTHLPQFGRRRKFFPVVGGQNPNDLWGSRSHFWP